MYIQKIIDNSILEAFEFLFKQKPNHIELQQTKKEFDDHRGVYFKFNLHLIGLLPGNKCLASSTQSQKNWSSHLDFITKDESTQILSHVGRRLVSSSLLRGHS